jgi:hypothetical protein
MFSMDSHEMNSSSDRDRRGLALLRVSSKAKTKELIFNIFGLKLNIVAVGTTIKLCPESFRKWEGLQLLSLSLLMADSIASSYRHKDHIRQKDTMPTPERSVSHDLVQYSAHANTHKHALLEATNDFPTIDCLFSPLSRCEKDYHYVRSGSFSRRRVDGAVMARYSTRHTPNPPEDMLEPTQGFLVSETVASY